jgi:acylphosphatase
MSDERIERLEAVVHGIVQGVFFRYNTRLRAGELDLAGTVENCADGTVKVVAEGPRPRLQDLLAWLRVGPEAAVVDRVEARWEQASRSFQGFHIVR